MLDENNIFFSKYAKKYCLGTNLNIIKAKKLEDILMIKYGFGNSQYQVLIGDEMIYYENGYNFVISHCNQKELISIIPRINEIINEI